jgi:predicted protein tyrosine phosphatase
VFSGYAGVETLSAGTAPDAETPISGDLIEWADVIFAMERVHRTRMMGHFGSLLREKRIVVLGVRDVYGFMDEELVRVLREKVGPYLPG